MSNIKRTSLPVLDEQLGEPIEVLDHGFVRLVDYMGDDSAIVQAARVSYGAGTKKTSEDRGLIRYLMRHRHTTPFEMCEIKIHAKMPLFVARQWVRHRTANINEYSARYSEMPEEFYCPELEQISGQDQKNRQSRGVDLPEVNKDRFAGNTAQHSVNSYGVYKNAIDDGIAREIARINLPVSNYTEWYWKIDLHNLFHFLSLRLHSHAQYEIRVYAEALAEIVKQWVPMAWEAFQDYRLNGMFLSGAEIKFLKTYLDKVAVDEDPLTMKELEDCGLSKREAREFTSKLDFKLVE